MSEQDEPAQTGAQQDKDKTGADNKAGARKKRKGGSGGKRFPAFWRRKKARPRRSRIWPVVVIILLGVFFALGGTVGAAYLWFVGGPQTQRLRSQVQQLHQRVQSQSRTIQKQGRSLEQMGGVSTTQEKLLQRTRRQLNNLNALDQKLSSVEDNISQLNDLVRGGHQIWLLDEVEELLLMANDRLALRDDIPGALQAFQIAQRRLGKIADPRLTGVRKHLSDQIAALQSVPRLDTQGMALELSSLAGQVRQLPLKKNGPSNYRAQQTGGNDQPGQPWWRRLGATIGATLKDLVRIRRTDKVYQPLLPPKESFFLYQNLELKLESARQALLQRQNSVFHDSLKSALQWLTAYFNADDSGVQAMTRALKKMQGENLQPRLPEAGDALAALRHQIRQRTGGDRSLELEPAKRHDQNSGNNGGDSSQ